MPSDPAGMQPQGVLVRPAPDFFDDHLAFGGYFFQNIPNVGENYVVVSLVNNANSGLLFKVYGISHANDGGEGASAWLTMAPVGGTLVGPCNNIRPDQGAPYGQIFQSINTDPMQIAQPFPVPATAALLGTSGFDSMTYFSPFPMFIIPVGYALNVVNNNSAGPVGTSFWYQQANE